MATEISEAESNYLKIALLLLQVSRRAVKIKFDYEFHPDSLQKELRKSYSKLLPLKNKRVINQHQWDLMFPKSGNVQNF